MKTIRVYAKTEEMDSIMMKANVVEVVNVDSNGATLLLAVTK